MPASKRNTLRAQARQRYRDDEEYRERIKAQQREAHRRKSADPAWKAERARKAAERYQAHYKNDPARRARDAANSKGWHAARNVALRDYRAGHPCVDCGEPDPLVLEFDHITAGRPKLWNLSRDSALAEVEKHCEVRCANCHTRRHRSEAV